MRVGMAMVSSENIEFFTTMMLRFTEKIILSTTPKAKHSSSIVIHCGNARGYLFCFIHIKYGQLVAQHGIYQFPHFQCVCQFCQKFNFQNDGV